MAEEKIYKGKIFKEYMEINGKKYEHIGFKDENGRGFGSFLAKHVGEKVEVIFRVLDE